jgi:xanthine/uracil permease
VQPGDDFGRTFERVALYMLGIEIGSILGFTYASIAGAVFAGPRGSLVAGILGGLLAGGCVVVHERVQHVTSCS